MILGDTGPIVANAVLTDPAHDAVVHIFRTAREPIVVPSPVLGEVGYFLGKYRLVQQEARFLRTIGTGAITILDPVAADYLRAADLVEQYADFPLGTVDALIVAMAERLNVTTIFTLDRRHFGAIKPLHCESFTLVP